MPKSFEDGIIAAAAIATEYGLALEDLRPFAAAHLQVTHPDLHEVGTSDVSCHLSALGNYHADLLRATARDIRDRDDLVARVSAATGRTAQETLHNLRRLFDVQTGTTPQPQPQPGGQAHPGPGPDLVPGPEEAGGATR